MKAIAIDIGGSHASCAVVDESRILTTERIPVRDARGLEALLPHLTASSGSLLERCGLTARDCAGVAVSFPGIVDPVSGRIFSTPKGKYDDARGVDLLAWSRAHFGLPLRIENDARMALLGEAW